MTHVLGLTGGIASGKSTVSREFAKKGIPVIDADLVARKVMEPGQPTLDRVIKLFGEKIMNEDQTLNRQKLGELVFSHPKALKQLNQIVHGSIYEWIVKEKNVYIEQHVPLLVLDVPLLIEAGYKKEIDEMMVVYVSLDKQIERLMKRDAFTKEEALSRIQSQLPLDEKVKQADIIINNNGTIEETIKQVDNWLKEKAY